MFSLNSKALRVTLGIACCTSLMWTSTMAQSNDPVPVPEELLDDEHLREEFGVNKFTAPSIRKIFDQMDALGTLPYETLKRPLFEKAPSDRVLLSLGLGIMIGDGFLIVQCEKIEEMENLGRALLRYGKALGTGTRINKHSQSLLEYSVKGDWNSLRKELGATQSDVQAEMVQLRDSDVAHLISLGGWLRAFEIGTSAVEFNYSPVKSKELKHAELVEYFIANLETLHPKIFETPYIKDIHDALVSLQPLLNSDPEEPFTEEQVVELKEKAEILVRLVRDQIPVK